MKICLCWVREGKEKKEKMRSKALKGIVMTVVLAATMLLLLSAVQVTVTAPMPPPVEINEVFANPSQSPERPFEWVEIINTGVGSVDVTNWYLTDNEGNWTIVSSTVLNQWDCYVFNMSENYYSYKGYGAALSNSGEWVALIDNTTTPIVVVDNMTYASMYTDESHSQIFDGEYDLWDHEDMTPSRGVPNRVHSGSLKINEVFYDPPATGDEFIELYNPTTSPQGSSSWVLRQRYHTCNLIGPVPAGEHVIYEYNENLTFYMGNSYEFVALENELGQIVDLLNYGGYYYHADDGSNAAFPYAAPDVATGHSLERSYPGWDTDKDSDDFIDQDTPSPCTLLFPAVGGHITPIDKLLMIMPWIGLASAIAIAAATTAITFKKRRP